MKKELLIFFIFLLFGMLIGFPMMLADNNSARQGSNNNNSGSNNQPNVISANDDNESEEEVCCHIYGLGSMMKKVNSQYELMEEDNCTVPEDFVGGGREIVSEKRCEEGYTIRAQTALQSRNRLRLNASEIPRDCRRIGSVIRCELENGKVMVVMAGKSGNTIIKFNGGENVSTRSELYHHNGQVYGVFENETKLIEYIPEQLREIIRERTQARLNNTNITLNENGEYEYEAEKESKFLGLFKVKEKVKWFIDPETGEIIREKGPWWGFLARDIEEES